MQTYKIYNKTKGTVIADKLLLADSVASRMTGLLNRESLPKDEGLIITRCNSIHMFFMRFPIDVLFVDKDHAIVGLIENIQPFALSPVFFKASYAIEVNPSSIQASKTALQDHVEVIPPIAL